MYRPSEAYVWETLRLYTGHVHLYVHRSTRSIKSDKMLPPQAAKQRCVNMIFKKKKKKKKKRTEKEEEEKKKKKKKKQTKEEDNQRRSRRRRAKCSKIGFFSLTERLLVDDRPSDTRRTKIHKIR